MVSQIMCEKNDEQQKRWCVLKNMLKPQMSFKPF
jgi:hypothetical protein